MQNGAQKGLASGKAVTVMAFFREDTLNALGLFVLVFKKRNAHQAFPSLIGLSAISGHYSRNSMFDQPCGAISLM